MIAVEDATYAVVKRTTESLEDWPLQYRWNTLTNWASQPACRWSLNWHFTSNLFRSTFSILFISLLRYKLLHLKASLNSLTKNCKPRAQKRQFMVWKHYSLALSCVHSLIHSCLSFTCDISRPVHGLIFLFKWKPGEEPAGPIVHESRSLGIFFAKQASWTILQALYP